MTKFVIIHFFRLNFLRLHAGHGYVDIDRARIITLLTNLVSSELRDAHYRSKATFTLIRLRIDLSHGLLHHRFSGYLRSLTCCFTDASVQSRPIASPYLFHHLLTDCFFVRVTDIGDMPFALSNLSNRSLFIFLY